MTSKQLQKIKEKERKMKVLIEAALNRFDADELLQMLYDVADEREQDDLNAKMIDMTTENGAMYIKVDSIVKQDKLKQFLSSEIFPYYNEQQTQIFSY